MRIKAFWFFGSSLLVFLLAGLSSAQAPAGFRTIENKLSGLSYYYPVIYKQIPLPPTERILVGKYVRKHKPRELSRMDDRVYKGLEPQIYVFLFKNVPPATPGKKKEKKGPTSINEEMEAKNQIFSFADLKSKRLGRWATAPVKKKPGHFTLKYNRRGFPPSGYPTERVPKGYLAMVEKAPWVMGVYGYTYAPHHKNFCRTLTKMVRGLSLTKGNKVEFAENKLDKIYAKKKFRAVEKRKEIRRTLAKGWKIVDTENFIFLHHSKNTRLVNKVARDVEAMRLAYAHDYPSVKPITEVGIVRVCRTKDEYTQYGGPPGSGGYWHPGNKELVFFDYSQTMRTMTRKEKKRLSRSLSNRDSMLVLYHESFHQYIYFALGEFSPHYWFNEGTAEYYSGAVIPQMGKKITRIGPAPWRIVRAINQCKDGKGFIPLKVLLYAERQQFYDRRRMGDFYAAGWSFVYFLKRAKVVQEHPLWSKILSGYFSNLQTAVAANQATQDKDTALAVKRIAEVGVRRKVMDKVLQGIDLAELEDAWRDYVSRLRKPKKK